MAVRQARDRNGIGKKSLRCNARVIVSYNLSLVIHLKHFPLVQAGTSNLPLSSILNGPFPPVHLPFVSTVLWPSLRVFGLIFLLSYPYLSCNRPG